MGSFSKNSVRRFSSSAINCLRTIMEDIAAPKPKKVLTEAQRLAFLKGREKRMANLEKKRLEKMEALEPTPSEPVSAAVPPPPPEPEPKPIISVIDEDKIAQRVAALVAEKLPKKREYNRRPKPAASAPAEEYKTEPPPVRTFSWT